jgi:hypothetical protein
VREEILLNPAGNLQLLLITSHGGLIEPCFFDGDSGLVGQRAGQLDLGDFKEARLAQRV